MHCTLFFDSLHFNILFRLLQCSKPTYALYYGQIPSRLADQPISVLDEQYEEVAVFLHGYSSVHASLEELSISHELVDWLKGAMKGIL